MDDWWIERASLDDKDTVYDLLVRSFFTDEPASRALIKIHGVPPMDSCLGMAALPQGMSYKVVTNDGRIVGVSLNLDHDHLEHFNPVLTEPLKTLYPFFEMIDQNSGGDEPGWLGLHILAVDEAWRKRGVADRLVAASEEESRRRGYKGLRVVCTSAYSGRLMVKRGFQLVYTYHYSDYLDSRGMIVFDPPAPHKSVNVYVKRNEPLADN